MNATHQHPSQYSDAELLRILRVERTRVTRELVRAKQQLRQMVSTVNSLETRLHNIEASEDYLTKGRPQ